MAKRIEKPKGIKIKLPKPSKVEEEIKLPFNGTLLNEKPIL